MTYPKPPKRIQLYQNLSTQVVTEKVQDDGRFMEAEEVLAYANALAKQARLDALQWCKQTAMASEGDTDFFIFQISAELKGDN
jgi:hypothetical protein